MKSKLLWLEAALLGTPFLALALWWQEMPSQVPVHWNLHGQIDGWASKGAGLFLPLLLGLGTNLLLRVLPRLDPKLQRRAGAESRLPHVLAILRVTLAAFFAVIFSLQFLVALGHDVPAGRVVISACLLLFAILGNYLTTVPANYFLGIRTPWTLESPETWRATHRLGGRLMFFGALALLVLQFLLGETLFFALFFSSVIALALWAFWYSWRHFEAHKLVALR